MLQPIRRAACAALVLSALPAAGAAAATVHVRVEGAKRNLVDRTVRTPGGTVGKSDDPAQRCRGGSALGAIDRATRGRWDGRWFEGLGWSVDTVRGERHDGTKTYFAFWRNHRMAMQGACATTVKNGDELLLFVDKATPGGDPVLPLEVRAPARATTGRTVRVLVVRYTPKGKARRVAGATVRGGGEVARTNRRGVARLRFDRAGRIALRATKEGLVRSGADVVRVRRS